MTPDQAASGRIGVELMTAWAAGDDSNELFAARLGALEARLGVNTGLLMACAGLAEVGAFLLTLLSQVLARSPEEVMQEIAKEFHAPASEEGA
jgi:hypothetical protein